MQQSTLALLRHHWLLLVITACHNRIRPRIARLTISWPILKNLAIVEMRWPWKNTWPFYEIWPFLGHFFSCSHCNEYFNKYFVFFTFLDGLHVNVTVTPRHGASPLCCFEVCSNDSTLAASWFCTNVSVSDSLMLAIGSCYTCIWRLLHSVVWLIVEAFCIVG